MARGSLCSHETAASGWLCNHSVVVFSCGLGCGNKLNLTGGAIFYYDGASERADENLKIQDYDKAPNKTPKIGLFDHKWTFDVGTTTATVQIPQNNFYGIHVDLALVVDCSTP